MTCIRFVAFCILVYDNYIFVLPLNGKTTGRENRQWMAHFEMILVIFHHHSCLPEANGIYWCYFSCLPDWTLYIIQTYAGSVCECSTCDFGMHLRMSVSWQSCGCGSTAIPLHIPKWREKNKGLGRYIHTYIHQMLVKQEESTYI